MQNTKGAVGGLANVRSCFCRMCELTDRRWPVDRREALMVEES
jgi:hypothetical protein